MASPATSGYEEENTRELWALVPFSTRSPITKPVFFHSPDEVRRCLSTPIFVGWGESKVLETRANWLKAIATDLPAPIVPPLGEEIVQAFSPSKPPKSRPPQETIAALYEQWLASRTSDEAAAKLAQYILEQYGFTTYRLYMSIDKKRAARILRKHGSPVFLQFMNWRRCCLNPPGVFVQIPAPVHRVSDDEGPTCNLRLSDYVQPDELNLVSGGFDTLLDSCLVNPLVPYCLYPDWNFPEIQRRASRSHWHQAPQRKLRIRNAREHFARVALELDAALRACWPNLSTKALQAFWTSWEVSNHLTDVRQRVEEYASEPGAVTADRAELGEAQGVIESIIRHYVIECLEEAADVHAHANEATEPNVAPSRQGGPGPISRPEVAEAAHLTVHYGEHNNKVAKDGFASEGEPAQALAAYVERWTCSEASLARTARVDPSDLSKWKKNRLPPASDKKARIEKALKDNAPPTPATERNNVN